MVRFRIFRTNRLAFPQSKFIDGWGNKKTPLWENSKAKGKIQFSFADNNLQLRTQIHARNQPPIPSCRPLSLLETKELASNPLPRRLRSWGVVVFVARHKHQKSATPNRIYKAVPWRRFLLYSPAMKENKTQRNQTKRLLFRFRNNRASINAKQTGKSKQQIPVNNKQRLRSGGLLGLSFLLLEVAVNNHEGEGKQTKHKRVFSAVLFPFLVFPSKPAFDWRLGTQIRN